MAGPAAGPAAPPVAPGVPTQFLQINAIRREIHSLTTTSTENHMYGIPDAILNWQFPATAGYITRPQDLHRQFGGGQTGFSDFHTFEYDAAGQRKFFLITQCKPRSVQFREEEWFNASEQLTDYLNMQHRRRPARPVYGIVAIGKWIRFYKYDHANQCVVPWRPGPRGLTPLFGRVRRDYYDLVREPDRVQAALDWIKANH